MENETIKWPDNFSELQSMDSAFKCGICYDYMKTSMITLCSHTYCSLCIRKFLQYSSKCPTCFIETHENDLRNNRPLDNIIMIYLEVRNKLLRALRVAEVASRSCISSPAPSSNQSSQIAVSTSAVTPKSGLKSFVSMSTIKTSSEKTPSAKSRLFPPESPSHIADDIPESLECKVPLMFTSSKPSSSLVSKNKAPVEKAQCPVCQVDIPSRNINLHLDACLARSSALPKQETEVKLKKRNPLPKRLYHMMNDRLLKQELKSHGISVQGDRKVWLNRIRRFQVLYNSETDVDNPRPVSALIQQLEREEREEKRKDNPLFKTLSQKVDRYSNPDAIAKANKQYIEDNKSSFQKMIDEMKAREGCNIKPTKPINLLESDEESDELRIVGRCTPWNPNEPSTSTALEPNQEEQSKDSAIENSLLNGPDSDISVGIPEREPSPSSLESPSRSRLISESSVDSVFDFTPGRPCSTSKKVVKRNVSRSKSRSQTPDPFNETSSAISEHCLPDTDLYQSIFGEDEKNGPELSESLNNVCDVVLGAVTRSHVSLGFGESTVDNLEESLATSMTKRLKRKQTSKPIADYSESLAACRPCRNVKKPKSSPS